MATKTEVVDAVKEGRKVKVSIESKNLTAGLDWAGNSGKMIAHLLFKKEAIGEAFTISSAQNLTWGEIADIYTEVLGTEFEWTTIDFSGEPLKTQFRWKYDRLFDRKIDNSKVLRVTGLSPADFKSIKEGIIIELKKCGAI
jgi:nucleoside-diphosphate-sugar epimerase